jgi:hypothetical protein
MRTASGGSSSPEAPEESLTSFWLRLNFFERGGIELAVETVGFRATSPVGVCARGIELFGISGSSNLEPGFELDGELGTD